MSLWDYGPLEGTAREKAMVIMRPRNLGETCLFIGGVFASTIVYEYWRIFSRDIQSRGALTC
jgi:hypothetical protein